MRIEISQDTPEWREWRNDGITASSAGALLGESPYLSKYELWLELTGRKPPPEMNDAMRHGTLMEPVARANYAAKIGIGMEPACYQHDEYPFMRASLDGISFDGKQIAEFKCPTYWTWQKILSTGEPPVYWISQVQYQLICCGAESGTLSIYNDQNKESVEFEVCLTDDIETRLIEAAKDMWRCIETDTPPDLGDSDYALIEGTDFDDAASRYKSAVSALKFAKEAEKLAKAQLLEFTDDGNCIGSGLRLTRVIKKGLVNWEKIKVDYDIPDDKVEEYRKPESFYWKITETNK